MNDIDRELCRRLVLPVAVLSALLAACVGAPTLPDHLLNPAAHPKYPRAGYITAVGMSDRGAREAEQDAKARVAEQVRSEIEAVSLSVMEEVTRGGSTESSQKLYSEVKSRTGYAHAEMIRVDPGTAARVDSLHYAFAYLSRAHMFDVLRAEYEAGAAKLRRAAEALPSLADDPAAFTTTYHMAHDAYRDLTAKAFEIRAVTGRAYEEHGRDERIHRQLEEMGEEVLRGFEMSVAIRCDEGPATREVVLMALTGALARLGLTATPGACAPRRHTLEVVIDVTCRRGYFGPECEMALTGALVHCASGRVLAELELGDGAYNGIHTRDEGKAMEAIYERVTAESLLPKLGKGLSTVLPIDWGGE